MRCNFALPVLAAVAAMAAPQIMDLDMVIAAPDPTYTIASDATAQVVTINTAALIASASKAASSISIAITDVASASGKVKRDASCTALPTGVAKYALTSSRDNAASFRANPTFSSIAVSAPTPKGYVNTVKNSGGANDGYGFLGFSNLNDYDTKKCAANCDATTGCQAFNIYFERDPSVDPGTGNDCPNPKSVTHIKCALWGGPLNKDNAVNTGQLRNKFEVAVAGSNAYQNPNLKIPDGFTLTGVPEKAAINAPYDKQGYNTYMGATIFTAGAFDAQLCATYCKSQTQYNIDHPAKDGSPPKVCNFFNTYILYLNSASNPQGQYCSLYTEVWDQSYAMNTGQYRGNDRYFVAYSYTFAIKNSVAPAPSVGDKKGAVYQAAVDIRYATLQPFCSALLGYSAPVATAVVYSTTTPVVTSTVIATNTVTVSQAAAKRAVSQSTPNVLTKYPATVLSSACSMFVTQATGTSIVGTVTSVSTAPTTTTLVTSTTAITSTIKATPSGNAYCEDGSMVYGNSAICDSPLCIIFNMRIEGAESTIYEGPIRTDPRMITTPSGGTHFCDGTNNNANPNPGGTPTTGLDSSGALCGFGFDGTYSSSFQDFFITSIGDTAQTNTQFWGLLDNYQFTPTGGCQFEVWNGDEVLWAFDAFNANAFLKVTPPTAQIAVGGTFTFTVIDGMSGNPIAGASFNGATSDSNGQVQLSFPTAGTFRYKATRASSIRSNGVIITVS